MTLKRVHGYNGHSSRGNLFYKAKSEKEKLHAASRLLHGMKSNAFNDERRGLEVVYTTAAVGVV